MKIHTQAELTANIECGEVLEIVAAGVFAITLYGTAAPHIVTTAGVELSVEAWESSQPRVEAWESSQPRVVAWGSSQPRVVARGSSQPRVVAWGSSQPRVEAWESSQPRVEAWAYAQLSIFGAVSATCTANVSVIIEGSKSKVDGGKQTFVTKATPREWCEYYGVVVVDDVATVYKAVNDNYHSPRGGNYTPGTIPVALDWDGATRECGGGLHFSPSPAMARVFHPDAVRYLACPVALADIVVHPDGSYPEKIKARGCCAPTVEVDEDGERVEVQS